MADYTAVINEFLGTVFPPVTASEGYGYYLPNGGTASGSVNTSDAFNGLPVWDEEFSGLGNSYTVSNVMNGTSSMLPVSPQQTVTMTVAVKLSSACANGSVDMRWFSAAGAYVGESASIPLYHDDAWHVYQVTATVPAGVAYVGYSTYGGMPSSGASSTAYIRAVPITMISDTVTTNKAYSRYVTEFLSNWPTANVATNTLGPNWNWAGRYGAAMTTALTAGTTPSDLTQFIRITSTSNADPLQIGLSLTNPDILAVQSQAAPVIPGGQLTISFMARCTVATTGTIVVSFYDYGGGKLSTVSSAAQTIGTTWTLISFSLSTPALAVSAGAKLNTTDSTVGHVLDCADLAVYMNSTSTTYQDGATAGWYWLGTAGSSYAMQSQTSVARSVTLNRPSQHSANGQDGVVNLFSNPVPSTAGGGGFNANKVTATQTNDATSPTGKSLLLSNGTASDMYAVEPGASSINVMNYGIGCGDTVTLSAWIKFDATALAAYQAAPSTQSFGLTLWYGAPGYVLTNLNQTALAAQGAGVWGRWSVTVTVPQNATSFFLRLYGPNQAGAWNMWFAGITLTKTASDPGFFNPDTNPNASWLGTADNSRSVLSSTTRQSTTSRSILDAIQAAPVQNFGVVNGVGYSAYDPQGSIAVGSVNSTDEYAGLPSWDNEFSNITNGAQCGSVLQGNTGTVQVYPGQTLVMNIAVKIGSNFTSGQARIRYTNTATGAYVTEQTLGNGVIPADDQWHLISGLVTAVPTTNGPMAAGFIVYGYGGAATTSYSRVVPLSIQVLETVTKPAALTRKLTETLTPSDSLKRSATHTRSMYPLALAYDGQMNWCTNPSFETTAGGVGANQCTIQLSTAWSDSGTHSLLVTGTAITGAGPYPQGANNHYNRVQASPGGKLYVHAVLNLLNLYGGYVQVHCEFYDDLGNQVTSTPSTQIISGTGVKVYDETFNVPLAATYATPTFYSYGSSQVGQQFMLDSIVYSAQPITGYFDGNSPRGNWTGAAGSSPSMISTTTEVTTPRVWLPTTCTLDPRVVTAVTGDPSPTASGLHDTLPTSSIGVATVTAALGEPAPTSSTGDPRPIASVGEPMPTASGIHDPLPMAAAGNPAATATLDG